MSTLWTSIPPWPLCYSHLFSTTLFWLLSWYQEGISSCSLGWNRQRHYTFLMAVRSYRWEQSLCNLQIPSSAVWSHQFPVYAPRRTHISPNTEPQNITLVSQDLLHNLYVDNIVSGCSSEQAAVEYFTKSRSLLTKTGFNLHSWSSNCTQLQSVTS